MTHQQPPGPGWQPTPGPHGTGRPVPGPAAGSLGRQQPDPVPAHPGPTADPTSFPTPPRPQVWLDRDPLRPSWRAPRRGHRWRWVALGIAVVLLVAVVAVAAAGGFDRRTDDRIVVPAGTVVETGPYQVEFSSAVATRVVDPATDKVRRWQIRVYGTGRTTADRSGSPSSTWWAIGRSGTGIGESATVRQVGGLAEIGADFQPGMPMTTLVLGADFPAEFVPDGELNVIVSKAKLVNNSASGASSGLVYVPTRQYYHLTLPLTVVDG